MPSITVQVTGFGVVHFNGLRHRPNCSGGCKPHIESHRNHYRIVRTTGSLHKQAAGGEGCAPSLLKVKLLKAEPCKGVSISFPVA